MQDPIQGPQSTSMEASVQRAAVVQPVCNKGMHKGGGCRWSKRTNDSAEIYIIVSSGYSTGTTTNKRIGHAGVRKGRRLPIVCDHMFLLCGRRPYVSIV